MAAKLTEEVSRLTTDKEELQGQLEESKKALNQYLQQAAASDALAARLTEEVRWLTADRTELLRQIDLARYFFSTFYFSLLEYIPPPPLSGAEFVTIGVHSSTCIYGIYCICRV